MSNVLIGIIGVILFIGLALAGALFLGPRFQQSRLEGQAAAVAMQVDQISKAYDMHRAMEGMFTTQTSVLVSKGYLKSPIEGMFPEEDGPISVKPGLSVQQHFGENWVIVSYSMPPAQSELCSMLRRKVGQTVETLSFSQMIERRGTLLCTTFSGRHSAVLVLEKVG